MMTMSAVDFVEWFESEPLKATLAASGIIGTYLGIRSPGTAYVLLHHYMGEIDGAFRAWGLPRGGTGAIANAIAGAAREAGRRDPHRRAGRASRSSKDGAAAGVVLENGDEIRAKAVVSSVDPHRTFLKLVGREHLAAEFVEQVRALQDPRLVGQGEPRARRAARVHLPARRRARTCAAPSPSRRAIEYLERAYDDAKYGAFSRAPFMDIVIPSLDRPDGGAAGQARDVVLRPVRALPADGRRATGPTQREAFGDAVIDTLAEYAPNIRRPHPAPPGAHAAGTSSASTA